MQYNVYHMMSLESSLHLIHNSLCFHCKIGYCYGGVCGENINYDIKDDSLDVDVNPFSDNQPVIRSSNPDLPI